MKEFEDDFLENDGAGIDVLALFSLIWKKRITVLKVTLCCIAIGLFFALFSPEKYTSQCVFVPQMSQGMSSKYSSIASMMGVDMTLSSTGTDGQVNPKLYPLILGNPEFQKDLMYCKVHVEKSSEPITFYDYFSTTDYKKFNIIGFIAQYTIGLPRVIIGWFHKEEDPVVFDDANIVASDNSSRVEILPVIRMTKKEDEVSRILYKSLKMDVDIKKGFLTLSAYMPEAQASTELCQAAYQLLQEYIREFKKNKSEMNLAFVSSELKESRKEYESSQSRFAVFMDSNNNLDRATAKIQRIRLESDYELARQMYYELSKQELSAKVKVNEETVSFTELAPPSVPLKRTSPKRAQMMVIWTFLGVLFGCAYVIGKDKYLSWKAVN